MRGRNGDVGRTNYSIRAVHRVCEILDLLQQAPRGAALLDVARATRLPKSSAFRYLATLERRRYVERDPVTGSYRAGSAFLPLRAHEPELLARRARPHMERLRDRLGETINLGMLEGNRVIYLEIVESHRAMRLAARRGDRDPVHATALGKAIAANLPDRRVRAILEAEGMPRLTQRTLTDQDAYLVEMAGTRERGYALDDGEHEIDGRCVAVPVIGSNLPAAISYSAPASRFPLDRVGEIAGVLWEVASGVAGELRATSRREQILASALELFRKQGYDRTSLREISERLGISKSGLYHHFEAKDDLISSLVSPLLDRIHEIAATPPVGTDEDLRAFLATYIDTFIENREVLSLLANDVGVRNHSRVSQRLARVNDEIYHHITGVEPELGATVRAAQVLIGLQGAIIRYAAADPEVVRDVCLRTALAALSTSNRSNP